MGRSALWHDIEAKVDLLNFSVVAQAAAQLIRDSAGHPLTIGVSGSWGVGKSSLVKMVGAALQADAQASKKYIFLEFNAWLYQGFDDARQALLQAVADKLMTVAKDRQSGTDKVVAFAKRIQWLRVGRMLAPTATGFLVGGTLAGPVGALIGAVGGLAKGAADIEKQLGEVKEAYAKLEPELGELLRAKSDESLPKEIEGLRTAFEEALADLDVTLVVLVDDLDRCLPPTAISTLEAMRLLLHVPRTAFIIAADEQMIRSAVRSHFGDATISEELVTSYFDKLIQVPLRVPRLGVNEVKAYVMLLLAQLAERRGIISAQALADAQPKILEAVRLGWSGGLTRTTFKQAFGATAATALAVQIDIADQIAPILVTADQVAGNPRLIKRFLNNLVIRETIAKAQGMSVAFEELVKVQLFERCASTAAFDFMSKAVVSSSDGKAPFLKELEDAAGKDETYRAPHDCWSAPFLEQWVRLSPQLADVDLRPLLYLSRDRTLALAAYDELSTEARKVLDALLQSDTTLPMLVEQVKALGEPEAERILVRALRKARSDQWTPASLARCLNVTKAFPSLGNQFATTLSEVPSAKRPASFVPLIASEPWAESVLKEWGSDPASPAQVRNVIAAKKKGS